MGKSPTESNAIETRDGNFQFHMQRSGTASQIQMVE